MSKIIGSIEIVVGDLRDSLFREFLGPISEDDVLALKEDSLDRFNDFWAALRVYQAKDGYHLLFGHRRVRAAILKWGEQWKRRATLVEVTDEEKILLLGEAGWKSTTENERIGLVKLASAFLTEYGEGYSGSVDIDLLKERTGSGKPNEGSTRISNLLGKRLWPQQRVSDVLSKLKPKDEPEESHLLTGDAAESKEAVEVSSDTGDTDVTSAQLLVADVLSNVRTGFKNAERIGRGLPPVDQAQTTDIPKPKRLEGEALVQDRLAKVRLMIDGDLKTRLKEQRLINAYLIGFRDLYNQIINNA